MTMKNDMMIVIQKWIGHAEMVSYHNRKDHNDIIETIQVISIMHHYTQDVMSALKYSKSERTEVDNQYQNIFDELHDIMENKRKEEEVD